MCNTLGRGNSNELPRLKSRSSYQEPEGAGHYYKSCGLWQRVPTSLQGLHKEGFKA